MKILFYLAAWMVVLQPMSQALILLNYNVNKAYIAENFCVNKAKPEKKCEGKCHLQKELKKNDGQQKEPRNLKEFSQIVYFFENAGSAFMLLAGVKTIFAPETKIHYSSFTMNIFHPPTIHFC